MKRTLSLILCLLLMLPSLAHAADPVTLTKTIFSEQLITLPEGYETPAAMTVAPDGTLVVAAKTAEGVWHLLRYADPAGEPVIVPLSLKEGEEISSLSIAPDGEILVSLSTQNTFTQTQQSAASANTADAQTTDDTQPGDTATVTQSDPAAAGTEPVSFGQLQNNVMRMMDDIKTTYVWFSEDGQEAARVELSGMASQALALSGRRILTLGYDTGITALDATGTEVQRFEVTDANSMAVSETTLVVMTTEAAVFFDLQTGTKQRTVALDAGYSVQATLAADGTLYISYSEGLLILSPTDLAVTRAMETTGTLVGDPQNGVSALGVLPGGLLAVLLTQGGGGTMGGGMARGARTFSIGGNNDAQHQIAIYTPLDPSLVGNRQPFTITALRSNTKLRKAVSDFARLHPELEVNLQTQLSEDDTSPVEDHIRTLNTDLLAGKGGDVLILDGLPIEKYAQKGLLKDLSGLAGNLGLLPGILKGSTNQNGQVYAIPAQFTFETLWGAADAMAQVTTLADLPYASLASGQTPLMARTAEEWLELLFPATKASFLDANGKLDLSSPKFAEFLELCYTLFAEQGDMATINMPQQFTRGGMRMSEMLALYNGSAAFFPMQIGALTQIDLAYTVTGGPEGSCVVLPQIDGPGHSYTPSILAGINAQSDKQALAEEFLSILFSKDVQEMSSTNGLPTVVASLDTLVADAIDRSEQGFRGMLMLQGGTSIDVKQMDAAAWDALRALCDTLDTPLYSDDTLMGFLVSETESFFEGRGTATEAADAVLQRAWYYLNE